MRRLTLLLLLLLVGGLYWLKGQRGEEVEQRERLGIESLLIPGLELTAVKRLRIDNLERGENITLERGPSGRWFLVDPIAYLAEDSIVDDILRYIGSARGPLLAQPDLDALGLAPPRIVLELTQLKAEQAEEHWRIEVGAVDLDSSRVAARVPGHPDADGAAALVTRVVRSFETYLDRSPDDYRDRACTTIPGIHVVNLARSGRDKPELALEAFMDGNVWRRRDEPRVSMDPGGVSILVRALTRLSAKEFVKDAVRDVAPYGLDDPRLVLESVAVDGRREQILISTPREDEQVPFDHARWYVMRDGFPHVWSVRPDDLRILFTPTTSLYDYAILRAPEDSVQSLELRNAEGAGIELEKREDGWWVAQLGGEGSQFRSANDLKVKSLIAQLVHAELTEYAPAGSFSPGENPLRLSIESSAGMEVEATIGGSWRDVASGTEGRLFLRAGEELAAIAPAEVVALFELTPKDLEDLLVHSVAEHEVDVISVRRGSLEHTYQRRDRHWSIGERGKVSGERAVLLERLLRFEAEQWLDDVSAPIVEPLYVGFRGRVNMAFSFGRLADGTLVLDNGERRAALHEDQLQVDLHAAFLELFRESEDS